MWLTIIIPVYNVEHYLVECLESVFRQDISDCEIIAINDGSTDNSGTILDKYQLLHPELKVIHQINKGLSGARNAGIDNAQGEYLYFLDSDDFLLPDAIEHMLLQTKATTVDMIGFNAKTNNKSQFINIKSLPKQPQKGIDFCMEFCFLNGFFLFVNAPLYVYRKQFIKSNNLNFAERLYHEDIDFSMKAFYLAQKIFVVDIPIFSYRLQREGSISTTVRLKNLIDKSIIFRELDEYYTTNKFNNLYFYNYLFHLYIYSIMQAVENNQVKNRKQYFGLKDIFVMKKGIMNEFEFKLWLLAIVSNKLMIHYYKNSVPNAMRRLINITSTIIYACSMKNSIDETLNSSKHIQIGNESFLN